jgi:hypothetical protein
LTLYKQIAEIAKNIKVVVDTAGEALERYWKRAFI